MKLSQKLKKNLKIIIISFCVIVLALLILVIVQTAIINKKSAELNDIKTKNQQNDILLARQEEKLKYFESEDFKEDYIKYELENNSENIIYK